MGSAKSRPTASAGKDHGDPARSTAAVSPVLVVHADQHADSITSPDDGSWQEMRWAEFLSQGQNALVGRSVAILLPPTGRLPTFVARAPRVASALRTWIETGGFCQTYYSVRRRTNSYGPMGPPTESRRRLRSFVSDLLGFEVVEFDDHEVRHHVCPSATDGGNALGPISERDAAKVGEEAPSLTCTDLGGPRSGYDVEVLHGALDQKFRVLVPRSVDLRKPSERSWWSDVSGGSIGFRTVRVDLWRRGAGLLHVTPMWPISPTSTLRRALELSSLRLGVLRRQGLVPVAPTTDLVPDGSKTWAFMDDRKHRRTVAIPIEGRSAPVLVKLYPQEYAFLQQLYAAAGRAVPIHEMPQRMSKERAKGVVSKIRSLLRKAGIAPAWINFALETADTGHRLRLREDTTETT